MGTVRVMVELTAITIMNLLVLEPLPLLSMSYSDGDDGGRGGDGVTATAEGSFI